MKEPFNKNDVRQMGITHKAQMELMGLVVIVILITLGMLFMAMFAFQEDVPKKVFTRKGLASSTMSAGLKTTVSASAGCTAGYAGRRDLPQFGDDILEDCALFFSEYHRSSGSVNPEGYSLFRCQSKHSCQFFKEQFGDLLNQTLGSWGKHYSFTAKLLTEGGEPTTLLTIKDERNSGCLGEADSSGLFPIQAGDAGLIEAQLLVCD